ncbi:MAG: glycosyl hydrolase family 15, partial [Gammaproteobacteria bacterium]
QDAQEVLYRLESMRVEPQSGSFMEVRVAADSDPELGEESNWRSWRETRGAIGRQSEAFFEGVWDLVDRSRGLVIGNQWNPKRRLDHSICGDMTRGEGLFAENVEHLLNKIQAPEYRQLNVEVLHALIAVIRSSEQLRFDDSLFLDVIIGHAVRLHWSQKNPKRASKYNEYRTEAWERFYDLPPHAVANAVMDAMSYLLNKGRTLSDEPIPANDPSAEVRDVGAEA